MAAFPRFQLFDGQVYTLFGADKSALPLTKMLQTFPKTTVIESERRWLKLKNGLMKAWYLIRWLASFVGMSGLSVLVMLALIWTVGISIGLGVFGAIAFSLGGSYVAVCCRGWYREDGHMSRIAGVTIACDRSLGEIEESILGREKRIAEIVTEFGTIAKIPAPTRDLVASLVFLIASHNASVELYNAEAERAEFYVARGHTDEATEAQRLQALHETLDAQRQEIIETLMAADRACIALVCQPKGEGALITPNLELLRERLNALGEKVSHPLIDEGIIRRELAPLNDQEFARRLAETSAEKALKSQV